MSTIIGCVGNSGEGKSTSIRNLDPSETFIINVAGKALPFKGYKKKYTKYNAKENSGNYYESSDPEKISKLLAIINERMPHIKNIILDDVGMILSFMQFERANEKSWEKHTEIGAAFASIILRSKDLREDLKIVYMLHEDREYSEKFDVNQRIISVTSKMVREKLNPERLFTYTLFTNRALNEDGNIEYGFITGNDITCAAKSPMGVFAEKVIPNDLQVVFDAINAYENGE